MTRHRFTGIAVAAAIGILCVAHRVIGQETQRSIQVAQAGGGAFQPTPMSYADLERLYLDGKITAKQYQKYLNDIKSRPFQPAPPVEAAPLPNPRPAPPPVATTPPKNQTPPPVTTTTQPTRPPSTAPVTTLPPNTTPSTAAPAPKSDQISAVENKMDELLRAKAAREKAATNAPPTTQSAGPRSKRDRLNDLLRLYIEGKITEPEMNERRAKIIAEPE